MKSFSCIVVEFSADTGMMMLIIQEKAWLIQLAEIRKAEYKKEMEAYHRKIVGLLSLIS